VTRSRTTAGTAIRDGVTIAGPDADTDGHTDTNTDKNTDTIRNQERHA